MNFWITILILANLVAAVNSSCGIMSASECTNYHQMLGDLRFHAFISRDKWEETCNAMRTVLDCVYLPKYMEGCKKSETAFFDAQRDVINLVCGDGEYKNHVECLGNPELQKKVTDACITPFRDTMDESCGFIKSTRACITAQILTRCGSDDSQYMDRLAYAFLKPFAAMKDESCDLIEPVTPTAISTTAHQSTSHDGSTTAHPSGETTTTSAARLVLTSASLLTILIVFAISSNVAVLL